MSTFYAGTQAVAEGDVQVGVNFTGSLPLPFQITSLVPGWATTPFVDPSSKFAGGFIAQFTNPAPPGGSSFDWEVSAPTAAASSLSQYIECLRDLLHDPDDVYWSAAQKTNYINQGLQKRDRETGQNRVQISFTTTVGTDTYNFTQLGNDNVFDLIGVNLLYQNQRYVMGSCSFSELNATLRMYNPAFQWAPVAFARYGPAQFVIAPAPAIAYTLEVDCAQITPQGYLVSLTDTDPLPAPFDAPVCYWAARMAKYNERAYDEAREFEENFNDEVNRLDANKVGTVPSLTGRMWGWR
jgi:hypothetical protein